MKIAVIIPTLNEMRSLPETLRAVRRLPGDFEILVVDGGSEDDTVGVARRLGVQVLVGERGRGPQMNLGASGVSADVLLFLHADARLPNDAYALIRQALQDPRVAGGCFRLEFDHHSPMLRVFSFFSRFSFDLFHYGDCAYFFQAFAFREAAGYRPYPLMEDIDLWRRMRKRHKLVVLDASVVVSARRFVRYGPLRQQLRAALLLCLFLLGVSPHRLARYYAEVR